MLSFFFRELNVNDLQMKELQDQLEAENYFSASCFSRFGCLETIITYYYQSSLCLACVQLVVVTVLFLFL